MQRFLTKIRLTEPATGEIPIIIKAIDAKNSDDLKLSIIPKLPELEGKKYKLESIRLMEDVEMTTSRHSMLSYS